ncbi:hypothetical protein DFH08DRAFT_119453 [Mycena albidolilacea]|uniref:Uncharacterized protein n=1 Tax=Mycena albidolilacea TaxID=1033008 RepID=A0AAD6YY46_9AGAR|nr:hypothetical protein DFH08DRAFT_119453 [Mycena albidolilacea]
MRRSTGRICVDLAPGNTRLYRYIHPGQRSDQPEFKSLNTPSLEAAALGFLTLEEYHEICYWQFSQHRIASIDNPITFNPGAVISCSWGNQLEDFVEIAFLPQTDSGFGIPRWNTVDWGVVMENGWTRLSSSDAVAETTISLSVWYLDPNDWLSQANHIFKCLGISSDFEDYVLLEDVFFCLSIPLTTAGTPEGFLFLCPPTDFQIGPSSFKWPDCAAYWSFDPTGADPLSLEDAANLAFPSLRLFTEIRGRSWDTNFYTGLRQFHQAKGFDPDSQDLALHLGQPLYGLSSETHISFAHIDDQHFLGVPEDDDQSPSIAKPENMLESVNVDDDEAVKASPAEEIAVSGTFTVVLIVQLSLVLCPVLFWLYDRLWIWRFEGFLCSSWSL